MILDVNAIKKFTRMDEYQLFSLKTNLEAGLDIFKTIRDVFREENRFHNFYKSIFNTKITGCSICQKQRKMENALTQLRVHLQNLNHYINEKGITFDSLTEFQKETVRGEIKYIGYDEKEVASLMLAEAKAIRASIQTPASENAIVDDNAIFDSLAAGDASSEDKGETTVELDGVKTETIFLGEPSPEQLKAHTKSTRPGKKKKVNEE